MPVRASIHTLNGFSARADQTALLGWLSGFKPNPAKTFVVHGDKSSSTAFAEEIASTLGWKTTIPARGQIEEIA
ncbi:MBL fold metallo-hydrolase RNA specificity domain-containing protein [Erythrobacter aureus]|uniref:MBL fold metallo-hydrolase RNA specificity domain-containing protein n=1 Tax=Erythrobacter aureus TaxID=2182384 RepID=UPI003A91725B